MSRTTDQWKNLLDGATEGPWENREYGIGPLYADIYGGVVSENQKDEELAAVAPEAVAEVIRLREELEDLQLDAYQGSMTCDEVGANDMGYYDKITRILNPEEES